MTTTALAPDGLSAPQIAERRYTAVQAEICRRDLRKFMRRIWPLIDPAPLKMSWHIDALCEHLAYVALGDIKNLMVQLPPRSTKPVSVDARVLEQRKGWTRLGTIEPGDRVLTHRGRFRKVEAVHEQGVLPLLEVKTWRGRAIRLAPDHPMLTARGWVQAKDLVVGDIAAEIHPQEDVWPEAQISDEEARLLGYLIGDACVKYATPLFTNNDSAVLADFTHCAKALGFETTFRDKKRDTKTIALKAGKGKRYIRGHGNGRGQLIGPVREWLVSHHLYGKTSYTKTVPQCILRAPKHTVAQFLGAYWSCDGFISKRGLERGDHVIGCDSASRELMVGIQHLLARLGISCRIRTKTAKLRTARQGEIYVSYTVALSDQDNAAKFMERVPIKHAKSAGISIRRTKFDHPFVEDEIVSISTVEAGECRCLTIEEDHSFTAEDLAVHNSLCVSVGFPAWVWTNEPDQQFLCASYASDLANIHALLMRRLIETQWYMTRYTGVVILSDENRVDRFSNTAGGYRTSISVGSKTTGLGGNYLILDDANNAAEVEHEAARKAATEWHDNAWRSRVNDPITARRVYVGQRTHDGDVLGHVLAREEKRWTVLMLPLEYDGARKCITYRNKGEGPYGEPIFRDPREMPNSILCPERYDEKTIEALKESTPERTWNAQYQQQPEGAGGIILKRKWWRRWGWPEWHPEYRKTERPLPEVFEVIQSYDTAFEPDEQSDFSVRTTWGLFYHEEDHKPGSRSPKAEPRFSAILLERKKWKPTFGELRDDAIDSYNIWEPDRILVEKRASGHSLIQELRKKGLPVRGVKVLGDLIYRAHMASLPLEKKAIWYIERAWAKDVIEENAKFPSVVHDDQVSSCVLAWQFMRKYMDLQLDDEDNNTEDLNLFDPKLYRRASIYG